jgi:Low affinity iron permease
MAELDDRGRSLGSRLLSAVDQRASRHTQARQQAAVHRKLDEILQAMPGADNSLLTLEHASDDELHATGVLPAGFARPRWRTDPARVLIDPAWGPIDPARGRT